MYTCPFFGVYLSFSILTNKRLAREMTVWSSLRHGNILEFVGYHLSEDFLVAYLVSPYVKNGNVKDYLRKTQTTLEERLEVVSVLGPNIIGSYIQRLQFFFPL